MAEIVGYEAEWTEEVEEVVETGQSDDGEGGQS